MQITQIRLKNFRAFKDVLMRDIPRFAILVGANGTGKSTFLNIITQKIPVDGGKVEEASFFVRFKRLSETEFDKLAKEGQTSLLDAAILGAGETEGDIEEVTTADKKALLSDTNYRVGLYNACLLYTSDAADE